MSADNYYRICKHPLGGYAAVMGFASNGEGAQPTVEHPRFSTVGEAYDWAAQDYMIEYGIRIDKGLLA